MSGTLDDIPDRGERRAGLDRGAEQRVTSSAESCMRCTVILVLGLLFLVLMITVFMARSMSQPLRRLRADALEVAGRRLPEMVRVGWRESHDISDVMEIEPIGINATDEIGEVSEGLRPGAPRGGEAGSGRRCAAHEPERHVREPVQTQPIPCRRAPVGIIDSLEQSEQDPEPAQQPVPPGPPGHPDARRNSENLLVLAGHRFRAPPQPAGAACGRAARGGLQRSSSTTGSCSLCSPAS